MPIPDKGYKAQRETQPQSGSAYGVKTVKQHRLIIVAPSGRRSTSGLETNS